MAWSKATRIGIMLAIDIVFFLIEVGVGLAVGSLALMADAFHMLNDIISLVIGLWAVWMSQKPSTDEFSFGFKRYEILGAFFNAVFLIALCITIVLEALPRLFSPPEITDPKLILYVGCAGLASNLVGFFVLGGFHAGHDHEDEEHGYKHGHGHSHDELQNAEEGYSDHALTYQNGNATTGSPEAAHATPIRHSQQRGFTQADEEASTRAGSPPQSGKPALLSKSSSSRRAQNSTSRGRYSGYENLSDLRPSNFKEGIIAAAAADRDDDDATGSESEERTEANEETSLLPKAGKGSPKPSTAVHSHDHAGPYRNKRRHASKAKHANHNHNKPQERKSGGHSHNHADMGMNAMILHVAGDALGNIGVIISALVIWLSAWKYKYYVDPAVSLFIALIILKSCLPLSIASGKILCQATPNHIKIDQVKEDLLDIEGVTNCHHVHVWQLSDSTIVASLHLRIGFGRSLSKDEATYMSKYMQTAAEVQECLHGFGIHSATIQPEFCWDDEGGELIGADNSLILDGPISRKASRLTIGGDDCILECVPHCQAGGCCAPTSTRTSRDVSTHSHDSPAGHSHSH